MYLAKMQSELCDHSLWPRGISLLPHLAHAHARKSEGCTEPRLPVVHDEAGRAAGRLAKCSSLAASPRELCLQNILSRGLLVMSPSLHQCLRLVQLYRRGAVSFHTSEPAESLAGVIVTSQQRFANRHSEIKSCCRAQGQ